MRQNFYKMKAIISDIKEMKRIDELIQILQYQTLDKFAHTLLLIWTVSPLITIIVNLFFKLFTNSSMFVNQYTYWLIFLQQIGNLSLLLGGLYLLKTIVEIPNYSFSLFCSKNKTTFLLFIMLMFSFISTILSNDIEISLYGTSLRKDGLLTYFAYAGIYIAGVRMCNIQQAFKVIRLFVLISLVLSVMMLVNNKYLNVFLGLYSKSSIFYNINHFGYFLCLSILSTVFLILLQRKTSWWSTSLYAAFLILVITLIVNKSFGPYLAVLVALLGLFMIVKIYNPEHVKRVGFIVLLFLIISVSMNLKTGFLFREVNQLSDGVESIVDDTENAGRAGSGRWKLWINGIRFMAEKPLFGYGPDNLGERYLLEDIHNDRPHNEIIQIAASLGIPAALSYVLAIFFHFKDYYIHRKSLSAVEIGLFTIIFGYLISSMFGNTMFYTTPFFFMFLGLSVGNIRNRFYSDDIGL